MNRNAKEIFFAIDALIEAHADFSVADHEFHFHNTAKNVVTTRKEVAYDILQGAREHLLQTLLKNP